MDKVFYETLLDETPPATWPWRCLSHLCGKRGDMSEEEQKKAGLNDSMIHDFMVGSPDLTITGIRKDGTRVPVFVNGDWQKGLLHGQQLLSRKSESEVGSPGQDPPG